MFKMGEVMDLRGESVVITFIKAARFLTTLKFTLMPTGKHGSSLIKGALCTANGNHYRKLQPDLMQRKVMGSPAPKGESS